MFVHCRAFKVFQKLTENSGVNDCFRRIFSGVNTIDYSSEVSDAFERGSPIVALESTIITHGMPFPKNVETALEVEATVRDQGAVPATIAVFKGRIKVGLEKDMLLELGGCENQVIKTSRRDFPYVISKQLNGGTTVAGTLVVTKMAGIHVFATGGIGGVHRGAENSMDISADLIEIGRSSVAVVCSGVKSILDIGKTLEYLETQGICVATYGKSKVFPAFYAANSGFKSPYNVETPSEAALLLHCIIETKLGSGLVLAVPIPEEYALAGGEIEESIQKALELADKNKIKGKEVTPFVLEQLRLLTSGKSLESNIVLVKNNAKVAAKMAVELCKQQIKKSRDSVPIHCKMEKNSSAEHIPKKQTVVIGGSVLDCIASVTEDIKADGRTLTAHSTQSGGGVGRNLADALARLRGAAPPPLFISAIGNDQFGQYLLKETLTHVDTSCVEVFKHARTACYMAVMDKKGECYMGIGDMEIHNLITPEMITKHEQKIRESSLVVIDGNIPQGTIGFILQLSKDHDVPVWFEPTDKSKSVKPFKTNLWKHMFAFSPNFGELKMMAEETGCTVNMDLKIASSRSDDVIAEVSRLAKHLVDASINSTAVVTVGRIGLIIARRGNADDPFYKQEKVLRRNSEVTVRLYLAKEMKQVVNVIGAGDCLAAGFMRAMLLGLSEERCATVGLSCARLSLRSPRAVPQQLLTTERILDCGPAEYVSLL